MVEMEALKQLIFTPLGATLLLGFLLLLFVWSSSKSYDFWEKRGVPYVKPTPFFGSVLQNMKKPLHEIEKERYKKYGSVYGLFEGSAPILCVADPEHLRNIFVKDFQFFTNRRGLKTGDTITERMLQFLEGEDWKRVRTIVSPTFSTGKIRRMIHIFKSCSKVLVENFRKCAEKGEPVDLQKFYRTFTMDIIASAAFSTKIDSHNDPDNEFVRVARKLGVQDINYRYVFYLLLPRVARLFKLPIYPPEGVQFFSNATLQIINERKRTGQKRDDFLQLLLDTAEEEKAEDKNEKSDDILNNYEAETNDRVFKNYQSKKALSFDELVAQCVIFFVAGSGTTASALSSASYFLAINPVVQDKLVKELDDAIEAEGGELTYEAIQNMKYLDNVISETLRINPPAIKLERVASDDYKLGNTGIVIPKNTTVSIPVYVIHRDPKYFPDPEKFDPDRFSPEERAKRSPYTFIPFGAGPRNCIAMRFALVEVKVCLAYVLANFRIKKCSQTKVPLEYNIGQGTLKPKDIIVQMELRDNCPLKK